MKKITKVEMIGGVATSITRPRAVTQDACKAPDVRCVAFADLDFVGGEGCPPGVFIPGTKYGKSREIATVYYNKKENMVSIDDEKAMDFKELESLAEEEKQKAEGALAKEDSLEYFKNFVNNIKECAKATNFPCSCSVLDLESLSEGDKIQIEKSTEGISFSYVNADGSYRGIVGFDPEVKIEAGIICHDEGKSYKKKFGVDDCNIIHLTAKKSDTSKCCEDQEEWEDKTKVYFIKETDGVLYITTEKQEYIGCR